MAHELRCLLGVRLNDRRFCRAFNFGPNPSDTLSVEQLINIAQLASPSLQYEIVKDDGPHEAKLLMLDPSAAKTELGWQPTWNSQQAIERTFAWYDALQTGLDMKKFTTSQINEFLQDSP